MRRLQYVIVASAVFFGGAAFAVEYDAMAPFKFLGWSRDGNTVLRSRRDEDGKQVVTACVVGKPESTCKVLCRKTRCKMRSLAAVKRMGFVKPGRAAKVYYREFQTARGGIKKKKRFRARIPRSKITVRLGKWTGVGIDRCYPLSFKKGRLKRRLACLYGESEGVTANVYLSPNKKGVAVHSTGYAEGGESYELMGYLLTPRPARPAPTPRPAPATRPTKTKKTTSKPSAPSSAPAPAGP